MTFEEESRKENDALFALFMKHGVSTGDGEMCDVLAKRIVEERRLWARLVKAAIAEREAAACVIADRERGCRGGSWGDESREVEAVRQALRDLGVDVDAVIP